MIVRHLPRVKCRGRSLSEQAQKSLRNQRRKKNQTGRPSAQLFARPGFRTTDFFCRRLKRSPLSSSGAASRGLLGGRLTHPRSDEHGN